MNEENLEKDEKVISQVNQIINSLSDSKKEKIPIGMREFFKVNDPHKDEYIIDVLNMNYSELEEGTKGFLKIISKYIGSGVAYETIMPNWKELEIDGKIEDAVLQLEKELRHNFFLVNNALASRKLRNEELLNSTKLFGYGEENEELKPFKLLLNVFFAIKTEYNDNNKEKLDKFKIVYTELKKIM